MKLYAECEKEELFCSFSFAKAFYDLCKANCVNVETVAKMMLLESDNEKESRCGNE